MKVKFLVQTCGYFGQGETITEAAANCFKAGSPRNAVAHVALYGHPTEDPSPVVFNGGMNVSFASGSFEAIVIRPSEKHKITLAHLLAQPKK